MTEVLERAWQGVLSFLTYLWSLLLGVAQSFSPLTWGALGTALLLLLLLAFLLRRKRKEPRSSRRPEVLVSLGAISMYEGPDETGEVLLPKRTRLRMTVSNLNPYPMQVVELALKTPEMDLPVVAEVAQLIPPEGSVVVEEHLPEVTGEEGRLNLYLYAANNKGRIYRLQASFALEPWNARYKISPLNQTVAPAKQLASAGVNRVKGREWREHEARERERQEARREEPRARVYAEAEREGRPAGRFQFPDEF